MLGMMDSVDQADTVRSRMAERVYRGLLDDIADFRMLPGDRFTEGDVSKRFTASRTPVRDALNLLKREGYVDVRFRSGWHVCPFDFKRFDELYELRIVLELAAVEQLCQDGGDRRQKMVAELEKIWLVPEDEREQDPRKLTALDEAFHHSLVVAAGNREMAAVHRDITEKIRIVRRLDFVKEFRIVTTYREHGKLLRLLRRGQLAELQILLRAHIEMSKQEVRKITLHMLHVARESLPAQD
jgi:DNA-binding GntR family transcriptional regulator